MSRRLLSSGGALFVSVLAATLLAGCATAVNDAIDGIGPGDDGTGPTSVGGDAGKHDAGSYYGQPDTGTPNPGVDSGGGQGDPDTGTVVPPVDSGSTIVDAGTVSADTGTVVVDSGPVVTTCAPGSLGSFTTKYHAPDTVNNPGSCSASEIAQFYTACLDPVNSTKTACSNFQNGISGLFCSPCLVTPSTASKWGPLVQYPDNTVSINTGGCYATASSAAASTCAKDSQYVVECDRAACAACSTANGDFDSCATAAESGGCSQYVQSETTDCAPYASTGCALQATFEASFKSVALVMCGP